MNWTTLFKKFTNGKYFVGLLTVILLSIGSFSYADTISVSCPGGNDEMCTPFPAVSFSETKDNFCLTQTSVEGTTQNVNVFGYCTEPGETSHCYYSTMNENNEYCFTDLKELYIFSPGYGDDITYNFSYQGETQEIVGGNIVEGGTSNFAPIMTQLGNIASEFIPYMLYIAIACLGVTLAFKALKYILGYLQSKAKGAVRGK